MIEPEFQLWTYLSAHPLAGLTATLIVYSAALWIWERAGRAPLLNPVLTAIVAIAIGLRLLETPYEDYFEGAQFIHVMLGPATVALAIPLYRAARMIRAAAAAVLVSLIFGALFASGVAVGLAALGGASPETLASLAPKSVTTPVAMGVSEKIGGLPSLTAAFVVLTGVIGAVLATPALNLAGIKDDRARGFAAGLCSSAVGAARAFTRSKTAGAFASLALALNTLATPLLAPLLWLLIAPLLR